MTRNVCQVIARKEQAATVKDALTAGVDAVSVLTPFCYALRFAGAKD